MTTPHEAAENALELVHMVDQGSPIYDPNYQAMATAAIEALREGARVRLTEYMLNAQFTEPDGLIHRTGMINAILGEPIDKPNQTRQD